jgi:hypothetical protein
MAQVFPGTGAMLFGHEGERVFPLMFTPESCPISLGLTGSRSIS